MASSIPNFDEEEERLHHDLTRLKQLKEFEEHLTQNEEVPNTTDINETFQSTLVSTQPTPHDAASTVQELRKCLDSNLTFQMELRKFINDTKRSRETVEKEIKKLQCLIDEEKECYRKHENVFPAPALGQGRVIGISMFHRPYFKTVYGLKPVANEDLLLKTSNGEILPDETAFNSGWKWWSDTYRERLYREVRRECLFRVLEPHLERREELKKLLLDVDDNDGEVQNELLEVKKTIEKIVRETDSDALFKNTSVMKKVDWMKVAKNCDFKNVNHNTIKQVWYGFYSPMINRKKFSKSEDKQLKELANKYGARNWRKICKKLRNRRTPFQLIQRYTSKVLCGDPSKEEERKWSVEDDQRLIDAVKTFATRIPEQIRDGLVDWNFVADVCFLS